MTTNYGRSIRDRLLNLAKSEGQDYMKVLVRYLHERLLYRISVSEYKSHFLLKGSSLLYAFDMFKARPTIDVDLLGERIIRDSEYLESVFSRIARVDCPVDGVIFDAESIESHPIAVEKKYPGTCITMTAHLDTIIQPVSIDVGFGDIVTPYPLSLDYPLLIDCVPQVELYAYSLETLIAEKFHAMVDRDEGNSRMKDFFDVFYLFKNHDIDRELLKEAITATFKNRGMVYRDNLKLFTPDFAKDLRRNIQWNAFLRKIRWKETITFEEVMELIRINLSDYWNNEMLP